MDNAAIITELKKEKDTLELQCRGAAARITQLTAAIAALEGKAIVAPEKRTGPSVFGLITALIEELPGGSVFDQKRMAKVGGERYPAIAEKLRRGIYPAFKALLKKEKIRRCPGGFTRVL